MVCLLFVVKKKRKREEESSGSDEADDEEEEEEEEEEEDSDSDEGVVSYSYANEKKGNGSSSDSEGSEEYEPPARLKRQIDEELQRRQKRRRVVSTYNLRKNRKPTQFFRAAIGSLVLNAIAKGATRLNPKKQHGQKRKSPPSTPKSLNATLPPPPFHVDTFQQLVSLSQVSQKTQFRDCMDLPNLLDPLQEIEKLVGLQDIKNQLVNKIMFYCQRHDIAKNSMNHIVIVGPSGCGKTTLARSLAKLFNRMGHIQSNKIVEGNRRNMIGSYLGHTAKATQQLVDNAIGGTLLIDEAYSLGDGRDSGSDSYSKACVDTLNQNLTERGDKFLCIIVGYKESLQRDFFSLNPGLERRFPWRFEIKSYKACELAKIFRKMLREQKLTLKSDTIGNTEWFGSRMRSFRQSAGSVENLVDKMKVSHCRRVFGLAADKKGIITQEDLDVAFAAYKTFANAQKNNDPPPHMYI